MSREEKFKKGRGYRRADEEQQVPEGVVFGRNEVRELLKSDRQVDKIFVRRGDREGSIGVIVALAAEKGVPVIYVEREKLDRMCGGGVHQGVAASAAEKEYCTIEDILKIAEERGEQPFIVILDGVEDPHNLGAVIRSAECAGCHGVVIPKRRTAGVTAAAAKASAGAVEHIAVAREVNIVSAIDRLKEAGVWIYAAEAGGESVYETDIDRPAAFVFGSEGRGVSRLVKEKSDYVISLPLCGKINSLNVSAAASAILFERVRRRLCR